MSISGRFREAMRPVRGRCECVYLERTHAHMHTCMHMGRWRNGGGGGGGGGERE